MSQRLDKGMELFEEELDSLVEAAGGESCAAAGLEGAGMEVPPGSKLFGSWTKKAYRQTHKGRDPWSRCAPTITKQGLWLVLPSGREIKITVEVLHYLRTAEEVDYQYSALPDDMPEPTASFKVEDMLEPLEGFAEALRMRLDELPETCFTWPDGSHKKKYENLLPIGRTVGDRLPLHFGSTHEERIY